MARESSEPIYSEAYPCFDVLQAKAALDREPSVCIFKLGRLEVGQLIVADVAESSLLIAFLIHGPYLGFYGGELALATKDIVNPVAPNRRLILCPNCSEPRSKIFFKRHWACTKCHRIFRRSQVVDGRTQICEEHDRLALILKNGRPKGMHNRTYESKRRRVSELQTLIQKHGRSYASDAHSHQVYSEWAPATSNLDFHVPGFILSSGDFRRTAG